MEIFSNYEFCCYHLVRKQNFSPNDKDPAKLKVKMKERVGMWESHVLNNTRFKTENKTPVGGQAILVLP